jgi:acyl-CoA synthetase (AMP-forming)/AMP-acid ligase II
VSETLAQVWQEFTAPGGPFAVEVEEIRGVPQRVYTGALPNLRTLWDIGATKGDRPYLVFQDERRSYTDTDREIRSLAAGLAGLGIGQGDRIAIAMRNYPEWVVSFWATVATGGVAVALNAWWTGPELEYGLLDSEAKVLVCDAERLERVLPHLEVLRANGLAAVVAVRCEEVPAGVLRMEDLLADTEPPPLPAVTIAADDDALVLYTSGTTGHPKGAVLTHRACTTNVQNMLFWNILVGEVARRDRERAGTPPPEEPAAKKYDSTFMLVVPLFHVTGLTCVLMPGTLIGAKHVLMYKWDPEEALSLIERERVTAFTGVPTMSREMLASPNLHRYDTSSLATLSGGGAPVQPDLVEKIDEQVETARPGTGYGLTETAGVISLNSADLYRARPTTVGPVLPSMEAKVVDPESGEELPPGEIGELWVRGSNVFRGYLNRPDATAEAITDGFFRTGDLATLDEDGFVSIRDRAKDMVLRGGENVYCAEVEAAIYEHPAVRECAVFAVPDERLGEVPGAAVLLHEGHHTDAVALRAFVRERLAAFKVPDHVWFLDAELPRNANGKILKRELRNSLVEQAG